MEVGEIKKEKILFDDHYLEYFCKRGLRVR